MSDEADVVVAGGSVAGCTLATLLGREGARVVVLEKAAAPDHYKKVCTHFIQAGGTPVLERLGIADRMLAAGAVRNGLESWSSTAGWWRTHDAVRGFNLRRQKLDPMLRELASGTPNVELRRGVTVTGVLRDDAGRPAGLRGRTPSGEEQEVRARVVVGADGRGSTVARLAGIPGRVRPHGRFGYMAYYRGLRIPSAERRSMMWFRGRDVFYVFPNDDDVAVAAVFLHKDRMPEFKADREAAFVRAFGDLPRAPDITAGERITPLIGKLDMPNVRRPAARPGIAFVGDAAQASDPLWGVGIGFALQSASWLADELAGALTAGKDVDAALARYRRRHRTFLVPHHLMMCDFAGGRELNLVERTLFRAATRDPATRALMSEVAGRGAPLQRTMRPRRLARAALVGALAR